MLPQPVRRKPKYKLADLLAQCDPNAPMPEDLVAWDRMPSLGTEWPLDTAALEDCQHDWQRDGQTMMAVRWTCSKCGESYLAG